MSFKKNFNIGFANSFTYRKMIGKFNSVILSHKNYISDNKITSGKNQREQLSKTSLSRDLLDVLSV